MNIMNSIHILTYSVIHTFHNNTIVITILQLIFTIKHFYVHVHNSIFVLLVTLSCK